MSDTESSRPVAESETETPNAEATAGDGGETRPESESAASPAERDEPAADAGAEAREADEGVAADAPAAAAEAESDVLSAAEADERDDGQTPEDESPADTAAGQVAAESADAAAEADVAVGSVGAEAVEQAESDAPPAEASDGSSPPGNGIGAAAALALGGLPLPPGSRSARHRVGRGPGSGRGKTCGRGTKGQKSRAGVALNGFEGGQMPIHMRMPKRGFRNTPFRRTPVPVNLDRIQAAVDAGKLDAGAVIDAAALRRAGIVHRAPDGVRILGRGALASALRIEAVGASATATAEIERAGGSFSRTGHAGGSSGK